MAYSGAIYRGNRGLFIVIMKVWLPALTSDPSLLLNPVVKKPGKKVPDIRWNKFKLLDCIYFVVVAIYTDDRRRINYRCNSIRDVSRDCCLRIGARPSIRYACTFRKGTCWQWRVFARRASVVPKQFRFTGSLSRSRKTSRVVKKNAHKEARRNNATQYLVPIRGRNPRSDLEWSVFAEKNVWKDQICHALKSTSSSPPAEGKKGEEVVQRAFKMHECFQKNQLQIRTFLWPGPVVAPDSPELFVKRERIYGGRVAFAVLVINRDRYRSWRISS